MIRAVFYPTEGTPAEAEESRHRAFYEVRRIGGDPNTLSWAPRFGGMYAEFEVPEPAEAR